jgi:hypothetical protein
MSEERRPMRNNPREVLELSKFCGSVEPLEPPRHRTFGGLICATGRSEAQSHGYTCNLRYVTVLAEISLSL